jgi:hypothetical protein
VELAAGGRHGFHREIFILRIAQSGAINYLLKDEIGKKKIGVDRGVLLGLGLNPVWRTMAVDWWSLVF